MRATAAVIYYRGGSTAQLVESLELAAKTLILAGLDGEVTRRIDTPATYRKRESE